jgi:hypothetical protein
VILKNTKTTYLIPFWSAIVLGSIVGMHFLYVEFQNNNQGEYLDTGSGVVDFPYNDDVFVSSGVGCITFSPAPNF